MIPSGGDGLTVYEKMEIARQRHGKPFLLEQRVITRKEPKSDFLIKLEKRQARERMEAERKQTVVQIKGRAQK